jgi:hypothetical protein
MQLLVFHVVQEQHRVCPNVLLHPAELVPWRTEQRLRDTLAESLVAAVKNKTISRASRAAVRLLVFLDPELAFERRT